MGKRSAEEAEGGDELEGEGALDGGAEDDAEEAPRGKVYITRGGAENLMAELRTLLTVERPKVTQEVSVAAAMGDRSENAEYIYGKRRLREIDRRLRFLQRRLDQATIVDPGAQTDKSRVFFGATVELLNEDDESKVRYQLVGPDETDLRSGKISVDSPVGKALLGKREGDLVTVQRPMGEVDFLLTRIRYD